LRGNKEAGKRKKTTELTGSEEGDENITHATAKTLESRGKKEKDGIARTTLLGGEVVEGSGGGFR